MLRFRRQKKSRLINIRRFNNRTAGPQLFCLPSLFASSVCIRRWKLRHCPPNLTVPCRNFPRNPELNEWKRSQNTHRVLSQYRNCEYHSQNKLKNEMQIARLEITGALNGHIKRTDIFWWWGERGVGKDRVLGLLFCLSSLSPRLAFWRWGIGARCDGWNLILLWKTVLWVEKKLIFREI